MPGKEAPAAVKPVPVTETVTPVAPAVHLGPGPRPGPLTIEPEAETLAGRVLALGLDAEPVKKRGRKPGSKNKPKATAAESAEEIKVLGLAFDGLFEVLAVGLGEHWRTATVEDRTAGGPSMQAIRLAASWQPVVAYYQWEPGIAMLWVGAIATSVGVIVPKVTVSVKERRGIIGKLADWVRGRRAGGRVRNGVKPE